MTLRMPLPTLLVWFLLSSTSEAFTFTAPSASSRLASLSSSSTTTLLNTAISTRIQHVNQQRQLTRIFTSPSESKGENTNKESSSSSSKADEDSETEETSESPVATTAAPTTAAVVDTLKRTGQQELLNEANDALASVGWARPMDDEGGAMTSDDPFVQRINAEIQRDIGVDLDELLNPAKVVNLERDLYNLRTELASLTGKGDIDVAGLSTEECDGGGGGNEADSVRKAISKKESTLAVERRAVFRGWLKNVFLGQAVLSLALSWVMATNPSALFGGYDWYYSLHLDTSIQVLGFWWWWLFIVPSLRSRRPTGPEKKALDIAFIGTPLISLLAPIATRDTAAIWFANFAVVAGSYIYAFAFDSDDDSDDGDDSEGSNRPAWLKFIYKSLDFGTGRERGARR